MTHVHFMGIGGSGMSSAAAIAQAYGFEVSGCDLKTGGHDVKHLDGIDILAVTPAVFFQSAQHSELKTAQLQGIAMTWQEFMGKYLHKDKFLICVAGTHGKSTTTAMAGLLLQAADLNPTVEVGATVPAWKSNHLIGKSKYFVSEADEYYQNFLHYHPDIVILNNIEMDHPEYFQNIENILKTFQRFVDQIKSNGTLIYNTDSPLIHKLTLPKNSIAYSVKEFPKDVALKVPGVHNQTNAMGIIKLAKILKIDSKLVFSTLSTFSGIGRRMELIGEKNGVKVYDDYANHPTAFAATIAAIKEVNPQSKIWAIIEPHTFSRLRAVLSDLPASLKQADEVIFSHIFASREKDPGNFTSQDLVIASHHPHCRYTPEFTDIASYLKSHISAPDLILVMGSGNSNKLSRLILKEL